MKSSKILLLKVFFIMIGMIGADASLKNTASAADINDINAEKMAEIKLARCDYDAITNSVNLHEVRDAVNSNHNY